MAAEDYCMKRLIASSMAVRCYFVCCWNSFVVAHETASTLGYNVDIGWPQGSVHGASGDRNVLRSLQKVGMPSLALTVGCIGSVAGPVGSSVEGLFSLLYFAARLHQLLPKPSGHVVPFGARNYRLSNEAWYGSDPRARRAFADGRLREGRGQEPCPNRGREDKSR